MEDLSAGALPEFLTNDDSIDLDPDIFSTQAQSFFKTSDQPLRSLRLVKYPLHENKTESRMQRKVVIEAQQEGSDYTSTTWVGDLTPDGMIFENQVQKCVHDVCPLYSYTDAEKAAIASLLNTSVL